MGSMMALFAFALVMVTQKPDGMKASLGAPGTVVPSGPLVHCCKIPDGSALTCALRCDAHQIDSQELYLGFDACRTLCKLEPPPSDATPGPVTHYGPVTHCCKSQDGSASTCVLKCDEGQVDSEVVYRDANACLELCAVGPSIDCSELNADNVGDCCGGNGNGMSKARKDACCQMASLSDRTMPVYCAESASSARSYTCADENDPPPQVDVVECPEGFVFVFSCKPPCKETGPGKIRCERSVACQKADGIVAPLKPE